MSSLWPILLRKTIFEHAFEEAFTGDTNVQEHIDLSVEGATEQIEANGKSKAT